MKEVFGGSLSVIASAHYINKAVWCQRNNEPGRIREVLRCLDEEVKACVRVKTSQNFLREEQEQNFPVEFKVIYIYIIKCYMLFVEALKIKWGAYANRVYSCIYWWSS